jgi:hypothetical protein
VSDSVITKDRIASLDEFKGRGMRVADSNLIDPWGGIHHPRGNHILDVERAGYDADEVEWLEMGHLGEADLPERLVEAVASGKADVAFGGGRSAEKLEKEGLHVLRLPTLPMVNGTTITTTYDTLHQKDGLADRLVRAMILTIHYARVHPEESQKLLDTKLGRPYAENGGRAAGVARYPIRPYPTTEGVANAYELCCMQHEEAKAISPMALWDMHYLRQLDLSGFIDELVQEEPESMRGLGSEPSWMS